LVYVFAVSVGVLVYTYLLYPAILLIWAAVRPRPVAKIRRPVPLSVVLAVRDEEGKMKARIDDLLAQDYPRDLFEIIVVSDGSRDRTAAIAASSGDSRVHVIELSAPVGKAEAVNVGVAGAANDVIVFTDVRQRFSPTALLELTANLSDERVGGVSGELVIEKAAGSDVGEGVGLYWTYEKLIRRKESEVDSVVGASGSIYAVRRRLFASLPANTLLDDFLVPMRIILQGHRVVFERNARAFDVSADRTSREFARKVRTLAGNFQALALEKSLLDPTKNRVFFQMVSHKLTRLVAPYFLIAALASNLFLEGRFFRATLVLQMIFYLSLLLKFTPIAASRAGGLVRVAWTFVVLNAAAVAGLWVFVTGGEKSVWKKAGP
jgi:cellulose synthase/poly-beta-1,6-N-acetylglucosamine synthase-like glycosyltransferase